MYNNYKATLSSTSSTNCCFDTKSVKFIAVNPKLRRPTNLVVCSNSTGYSLKNSLVVKATDGDPLPNPAVLLQTANEDAIQVLDFEGNTKGSINVGYEINGVSHHDDEWDRRLVLSGFHCQTKQQRLLFGDTDSHSIHVRDLSGGAVTRITNSIHKPMGMCSDNSKLYVCEAPMIGAHSVLIFEATEYKYLHKITHEILKHPCAITLTLTTLFICVGERKTEGQILKFSTENEFLETLPTQITNPLNIVTFSDDILFITDNHRLRAISTSGEVLTQFGQEKEGKSNSDMHYPQSVCVVSSGNKFCTFVSDHMNERLARLDL